MMSEPVFYDIRREKRIEICGLYEPYTEPVFKRMPDAVAEATNDGVKELYLHTAGGRIRFTTDSSYVTLRVTQHIGVGWNMSGYGICGFDLYERKDRKQYYLGTFPINDVDIRTTEEVTHDITLPLWGERKKREFVVNFPQYERVRAVSLGIEPDAVLEAPTPYAITTPIVYYGSSITQGGVASHPGTCYQNWISRRLDCDYVNLGFSGSARGEQSIRDYLKTLPMSAFVLDYDHNAPSAEHLEQTHSAVYKAVRESHPDIPIVMISKPDYAFHGQDVERRCIIQRTWQNALAAGDDNVYYIDGYSLFEGEGRDNCTADGCHPNDLGMYRMGEVIGKTLELVLYQQG